MRGRPMDRSYRRLMAIQVVLALANASAAVFGFIFLLKRDGFAIGDLVVFSILSFGVATLVCAVLVRTRSRRGDLLMSAGLAILASSYAAYVVATGWPLLVYVGVAWGLYIPLFFVPFNALVIATTRTEDRAGKIGGFFLSFTAVSILAPTLGGTIIEAAGYAVVFSFAAIVLVADIALLAHLRIGREVVPIAFDFPRLGSRTATALFAEGGFEGLVFNVVPLLAYSFTQEELSLGGLFSLFALAGGVVTVTLGVLSDRMKDRRPFLILGAGATAASTALVVTATSLPAFALANSLVSLTSAIAPVFLFTMAVERIPARPGHASVTREVLLNGGRTTSLVAYLALLAVGVGPFPAFALAAVCLAVVAVARPWKSPQDPEAAPRSED